MKTFTVPHTDVTVSSVVLGLMRIAKMSDAEVRALYDAAVEVGVTMSAMAILIASMPPCPSMSA